MRDLLRYHQCPRDARRELVDARGIFCCFVCDACEAAKRARFRAEIFTDPDYDTFGEQVDDEPEEPSCDHEWVFTGTAYGGDDSRWHGEGRCYCAKCGADGDA